MTVYKRTKIIYRYQIQLCLLQLHIAKRWKNYAKVVVQDIHLNSHQFGLILTKIWQSTRWKCHQKCRISVKIPLLIVEVLPLNQHLRPRLLFCVHFVKMVTLRIFRTWTTCKIHLVEFVTKISITWGIPGLLNLLDMIILFGIHGKKNVFTFAKRNGKFCEWMHNKEIYYVKLSYFVFLFMNEKICYFWDLLLKAKAIHYSRRIAFAMAVSPHTVWKKVKFTLIWRILREINFQWKSCFHVILLKNLESEILKFSHCVSVTSRPFFKCMKPVK